MSAYASSGLASLGTKTLLALFLISFSAQAQEIQIGRPKLWLYDRLYPTLDGLLRDAEGISLNSLSNLDPNALNSRMVDFIRNVIQASVSADQTAGITNSAAMTLYNASKGQFGSQAAAAQSL